ncbi:type II toxin-antitoxin system PemK/MazF family toxin [Cellulomonas edaphi]|uniref:Type II toxin-antitoxin system PemK/MazF family toxin n=1 Tax=Cellulomonas edaphi TaxID=3053468 RepID=A0ABT7S961_9CELL|nr:type II toxin-antitoxin system PemK/MazF family toxin [Cellulomons edaphi]MDM7831562.1 type II toxin-antitoxin system PemK/MazF family toxin [Cellulomons edaphi]
MATTGPRGFLHRLLARLSRRPPAPRGLADYHGTVRIEYDPHPDGLADPGEIVWTWVPYEEDPAQGKDRPVLVVGRDGAALLALMLTSKDHSRDHAREQRRGRYWLDIGTGPWDAKRRPSEVRLDRVLRIDPRAVRREGCRVERPLFDSVAKAMAVIPTSVSSGHRRSW